MTAKNYGCEFKDSRECPRIKELRKNPNTEELADFYEEVCSTGGYRTSCEIREQLLQQGEQR